MWIEVKNKQVIRIPGYTGFCPDLPQQIGCTYGKATGNLNHLNHCYKPRPPLESKAKAGRTLNCPHKANDCGRYQRTPRERRNITKECGPHCYYPGNYEERAAGLPSGWERQDLDQKVEDQESKGARIQGNKTRKYDDAPRPKMPTRECGLHCFGPRDCEVRPAGLTSEEMHRETADRDVGATKGPELEEDSKSSPEYGRWCKDEEGRGRMGEFCCAQIVPVCCCTELCLHGHHCSSRKQKHYDLRSHPRHGDEKVFRCCEEYQKRIIVPPQCSYVPTAHVHAYCYPVTGQRHSSNVGKASDGAAFKRRSCRAPPRSKAVPNYSGFIQGYKWSVGETFGKATQRLLGNSTGYKKYLVPMKCC